MSPLQKCIELITRRKSIDVRSHAHAHIYVPRRNTTIAVYCSWHKSIVSVIGQRNILKKKILINITALLSLNETFSALNIKIHRQYRNTKIIPTLLHDDIMLQKGDRLLPMWEIHFNFNAMVTVGNWRLAKRYSRSQQLMNTDNISENVVLIVYLIFLYKISSHVERAF